MKIIRPYAKIMEPELLAGALTRVKYAAKVNHRSEENAGDSTEKFIRATVINHGDWSVTEHVSASVEFVVARGITHEIVGRRLAAYTQESTRFVNYAKKMPPSFIYPIPGVECPYCLAGLALNLNYHARQYIASHVRENGADEVLCDYDPTWLGAIDMAERSYEHLLAYGWRPQEASSVFPNALSSKIIMTCNLRAWRHFFCMRTSKEAHPQMRQVTIPLLKEFQRLVPVLYDDIIPEERQINNICKGQ